MNSIILWKLTTHRDWVGNNGLGLRRGRGRMVVRPVDRRGKGAGDSESARAERGPSGIYSRSRAGESGGVGEPEGQRRREEVTDAHLRVLAGL